jgi:Ran GTPase-activating protein (RanGAP) involved in mRNA processing and transport
MQDLHLDDIKQITEALKHSKSIISIELSDNYLEDHLVELVTESLINNKVVKALNLSQNKITDKGAVYIAELIKDTNNNITKIDLAQNNIGYKGARIIADAIISNPGLTELRLEGNPLGGKRGLKAIENNMRKSNIIFYNFAPTVVADQYMDIIVKGKYDSLDNKKRAVFKKIFQDYSAKFKFFLERVRHYSPQKISQAFMKLSNLRPSSNKDNV